MRAAGTKLLCVELLGRKLLLPKQGGKLYEVLRVHPSIQYVASQSTHMHQALGGFTCSTSQDWKKEENTFLPSHEPLHATYGDWSLP